MKIKLFFASLLMFLLTTGALFAQTNPCNNADDDSYCPLDSWVLLLAGAVTLFAAWHLYRKQKHIA